MRDIIAERAALQTGDNSGLKGPGGTSNRRSIDSLNAPVAAPLDKGPLTDVFDFAVQMIRDGSNFESVVSALRLKFPPMRRRTAAQIVERALRAK